MLRTVPSRLLLTVMFLTTLALLSIPMMASASYPSAPRAGTKVVDVESVGVVGFKKDFIASLTVTPYAVDSTDITEGPGHSKVTIAAGEGVFESDWVTRNVEFVAFRIHHNPPVASAESFFPSVLGCRYAKVVRVIDSHNLIVNFEYNGGSLDKPVKSEKVSGYFFIDTAQALRQMVADQSEPTVFRFQSGQTYVVKGMPNITFPAKEGAGTMWWLCEDDGSRANIKISGEDAYSPSTRSKQALPSGVFFKLATHDRSLYLNNINILGPTYTVPTVQGQWSSDFISYANGQCERTIEVRNCNTLAEKQALGQQARLLPASPAWLAPQLWQIGGGGKRGDRGDGVIDILGYQRLHLLRSTWIAWGIGSVKNNDGAGNWLVIDGEEVDARGMPIHMAYEATFIKRNEFPDVQLAFHSGEGVDYNRVVKVISTDFAWPMLSNQYWNTGLSTGGADIMLIKIDGFTLHLGNNGNFYRETGQTRIDMCIPDASTARLFERIPKAGDKISIEPIGNDLYRIFGWGLQEKDVITVNGQDYTIIRRKRSVASGKVVGTEAPHPANVWDLSFDKTAGLPGELFEATVKTSQTAYLLDGKPRKSTLVYQRDLFGHWQYNRAEMNYQYRNILFNGFYRQTSNPHDNKDDYKGLWEFPTLKEWVNAVAMNSDGSSRGVPAKGIGSQAYGANVLNKRNTHPDSKTHDHHILVDGGRITISRFNVNSDEVRIRNRPSLIAGQGETRIVNPVLLDNKGLHAAAIGGGISIALTDGRSLDLSNTVLGDPDKPGWAPLSIYGHGSVKLDKLVAHKRDAKDYNGVQIVLARGLPDAGLKLHITGQGGSGFLRLTGQPVEGSVNLTNWTVRHAIYSKTPVTISAEWLALPVSINGKPGDSINTQPQAGPARR